MAVPFFGSGFGFRAVRAESQPDPGPGSCAAWKRLDLSRDFGGSAEIQCLLQGNAWNDACSQVGYGHVGGRGGHLSTMACQTCQAAMRASHLSSASCSAVGACKGVGGATHGAQVAKHCRLDELVAIIFPFSALSRRVEFGPSSADCNR